MFSWFGRVGLVSFVVGWAHKMFNLLAVQSGSLRVISGLLLLLSRYDTMP
jgi:hypothetical protein